LKPAFYDGFDFTGGFETRPYRMNNNNEKKINEKQL